MKKKEIIDYSKAKNQIGCGWCAGELACPIKTSDKNRAKLGCPLFIHHNYCSPILEFEQHAIDVLNDFEKIMTNLA